VIIIRLYGRTDEIEQESFTGSSKSFVFTTKPILRNKCQKAIGIEIVTSGAMSDSRRNLPFPCSPFIVTLQDGYERIFSVVKNESFVFVVNGEDVQSNIIDAVLISTKIPENLGSTPGNFQFAINDQSITTPVFRHFLAFAHSHVFSDFSRDEQHLFVTISGLLRNEPLMCLRIERLSQNVKETRKMIQIHKELEQKTR
jgi:hypothetical protein